MINGDLSCLWILFWFLIIVKYQSLKDYAIRKYKNCVKAETEIYKIQKLTYIADFQALINGFYRNIFMH